MSGIRMCPVFECPVFGSSLYLYFFQDSAASWVKKQAKKVKEKAAAEKRAKVLAELEDEFGVGNIVSL